MFSSDLDDLFHTLWFHVIPPMILFSFFPFPPTLSPPVSPACSPIVCELFSFSDFLTKILFIHLFRLFYFIDSTSSRDLNSICLSLSKKLILRQCPPAPSMPRCKRQQSALFCGWGVMRCTRTATRVMSSEWASVHRDGQLGFLRIWSLLLDNAVWTLERACVFRICGFASFILLALQGGVAGTYGGSVFSFSNPPYCFPCSFVHLHSHQLVWLRFPPPPYQPVIHVLFDDGHSQLGVWGDFSLLLVICISRWLAMLSIFSCACLFGKISSFSAHF